MSNADLDAANLTLPIKRTTGETLEDRLTANAYENILPARYLRQDADGELVEDQEDLFRRVAQNIALAEAVYEAERTGTAVRVSPDQLKPEHPRRDELAAEVFGAGTDADDDVETALRPENVNKFAYETIVPELPAEIRTHVEETAEAFQELMEDLSFIPNSPTLMNAGDELQQLSACFVMSPDDDLSDIHETARKAAEVFQCLTADTEVYTQEAGLTSIANVETGDHIRQGRGGAHRYGRVVETHAYEEAPVYRVELETGIELTGTPTHRLLVEGEWREIDEIQPGDAIDIELGWLPTQTPDVKLSQVPEGGRWSDRRTVANEDIIELLAEGLTDYEIADELDSSSSTIQHRRANELGLPPNGTGGRKKGRSFDEDTFLELHSQGYSDRQIAEEINASSGTVRSFRLSQDLSPNGRPVKTVKQPEVLTTDLAELVGLWIGDGSKHQDGIRFHIEREDLVARIEELSERLFGTGVSKHWAEGCYELAINSHEIKRFWLENFGEGKPEAATACVPKPIRQGDQDIVAAFLRGLFSSDGTLNQSKYPTLYSASEQLIEGVHQLLLGLAIPSTTWEWDNKDRDYYTVRVTDETGIGRFARLVGFSDGRSAEMAERLEETTLQSTMTGDVVGWAWEVEVENVERVGRETVYDVTVEGDHSYVANSIVSHNSGGGVGYGFWQLRPYGDAVGSTGGIASGPITFMRTYDQLCETIAQGGTRRGAQMGIMRISHPDVIEFIHAKNKDVSLAHCLRLNDPDDYTYTTFGEALEEARDLIDEEGRVPKHLRNAVEGHLSNFNISVGVTDTFMEALENDAEYTFTNPRTGEAHIATQETKEMWGRYGLGEYVEPGEELSVPASVVWERIVDGAYENGEPGVIYLERVNEEHSFDIEEHPDHRILATNPCVTGDTLISTESGLVSAEDLYEQGVARDVVVDSRLSEEPLKEASSVFQTGEKEVYELSTKEGYDLRLTGNHRVMTEKGWVKAQNLEPGDEIHIQNRKGAFGTHGSAEEGRVLGWLVGDGHLKDGEERAVLNFYDEDTELSEDFAGYVNDIVREPVGNADYEVGVSQIQRSSNYRSSEDSCEERIRSERLYEIAQEAGLVEQKLQVPNVILESSEDMARGFLQALFTADGGVQGNEENGRTIRLASSDIELLKETQQLLLQFGIASRIYEERRSPHQKELPDGQGSTKTYDIAAQHELVISKENLLKFRDEVGFLLGDKNEALDDKIASYTKGPYSEDFIATVEAVESSGIEQVYDLVEPDTHSFIANGIIVHNCGEQPLEEYEACNLGHINLSTLAAHDAPDWRVWSAEHADEYASEADAIAAFLEEAIDWEEFDERIELATRFLENVVTMSDFPVEEITETVRSMRKIGLGIMGLAQLYIQLGVKYGSDEGNEIARQVMKHINHHSKWTSHELAEERGVFADWEDSKYADPVRYREWFEHQTGLDADEWADGFPIRNHNTTTIAPTGTTSMVGNTTGGCEPIYNVAYYKNVSDDVQGDEMLVEFDDYFLRVLEANEIDVEAVKAEAQEQMANNAFDGVEGLSTVPDAIGELFVITADLSGKQHAAVQCACQAGVDSAISKTCNFPHDATKEDMDEVYRYIYEHGGKGVTVYRDGTRSKQVLTTRADNAEFADENEAAEVLLEQIEEVFGSIEAFTEHETVKATAEDELASLSAAAFDPDTGYAQVRDRPDVLNGVTQRVDTGYGKLYVNINEDEHGRPFELFATIGNSGGFTNSFTEALAKTISTALRAGVDPREIATELQGIRSPKVAWDKGQQINSVPDAIGTALQRYLDGDVDPSYPQQQNLTELEEEEVRADEPVPETDGGGAVSPDDVADATQRLLDAGESPECPDCGSMSLHFIEGCKTCGSCGWSEC